MSIEGRVDMHHVLPPCYDGHPSRYSQTNTPLPCPPEDLHNLDYYIPSFEDILENRVVDEIAFTDTQSLRVSAPVQKRPPSDEDAAESREGGGTINNGKITSSRGVWHHYYSSSRPNDGSPGVPVLST